MSGTIATLTDWGVRVLNPIFLRRRGDPVCGDRRVGRQFLDGHGHHRRRTCRGRRGPRPQRGHRRRGSHLRRILGDKMSPLSETTNLAAAVAGTDLYKHIRSMMSTTVPAIPDHPGHLPDPRTAREAGRRDRRSGRAARYGAVLQRRCPDPHPAVVVIILALRKIPPTLCDPGRRADRWAFRGHPQPNAVRASSAMTHWVPRS